jgi:hypothetical protein
VSVDTGGGTAIEGNVKSGDFTGRDDRQQNVNLSFAPSEPSLRQPGVVYTIQEMFAAMERKLDEHGHQLQAIWQKVVTIEFEQAALKREFDEMKHDGEATQTAAEKERHQQIVLLFCVLTVICLGIIIVMLAWLIISHLGAL